MITGIAGRAQSGKDTVGKIFQKLYNGWVFDGKCWVINPENNTQYAIIRKFADKLKDSVEFKFPNHFKKLAWEAGGDEYRNLYLPFLKMTRRTLLIEEAMALRGICKDYWVEALMQDYQQKTVKWNCGGNSTLDAFPNWIITDLRFPNEYEKIKSLGGVNIRVERNDCQIIDNVSEISLDGHKFDYVIFNNGTLEELIKQVTNIYNKINE